MVRDAWVKRPQAVSCSSCIYELCPCPPVELSCAAVRYKTHGEGSGSRDNHSEPLSLGSSCRVVCGCAGADKERMMEAGQGRAAKTWTTYVLVTEKTYVMQQLQHVRSVCFVQGMVP